MADTAPLRRRTNWRRLAAWFLMAGTMSAVVYFGVSARLETKIERRGTPCVDTDRGPSIRPSKGCSRLAELLLRTCVLNADVCRRAVRDARRGLSARDRREFDSMLRRVASDADARRRREARRGGRSRGGAGEQGERGGRGDGGSGGEDQPPGSGGTGGTPGAQGGGSGAGPAGPSAPARPSPSDVVNGAVGNVVDTTNDAAEAIGGGRPLGPVPQVPRTPQVPCVPTAVTHC